MIMIMMIMTCTSWGGTSSLSPSPLLPLPGIQRNKMLEASHLRMSSKSGLLLTQALSRGWKDQWIFWGSPQKNIGKTTKAWRARQFWIQVCHCWLTSIPAEATQFCLVSLPYLKAPLLQPTQGLELRDLRSLGILPAHFGNDLICALPGGAAAQAALSAAAAQAPQWHPATRLQCLPFLAAGFYTPRQCGSDDVYFCSSFISTFCWKDGNFAKRRHENAQDGLQLLFGNCSQARWRSESFIFICFCPTPTSGVACQPQFWRANPSN